MKKNLLTALIALTSVAAFTTAKATPVTWVAGDVILGIEDAAHTKNLLIDLGAGASLASSLTGGTFSTINILSDLNTTFGTNWSSASLNYGVFGLPASKAIVYASVASGNTAPVLKASGALATTLSHYGTLGAGYNNDIASQGLSIGVYQNVNTAPDTGFATWSGNTPSTSPFVTYNVSFENVAGSALDIYGTTGSSSTQLGTVVLSTTDGTISAVPEPSTYVLFGLGALVLVIAVRRRSNA